MGLASGTIWKTPYATAEHERWIVERHAHKSAAQVRRECYAADARYDAHLAALEEDR